MLAGQSMLGLKAGSLLTTTAIAKAALIILLLSPIVTVAGIPSGGLDLSSISDAADTDIGTFNDSTPFVWNSTAINETSTISSYQIGTNITAAGPLSKGILTIRCLPKRQIPKPDPNPGTAKLDCTEPLSRYFFSFSSGTTYALSNTAIDQPHVNWYPLPRTFTGASGGSPMVEGGGGGEGSWCRLEVRLTSPRPELRDVPGNWMQDSAMKLEEMCVKADGMYAMGGVVEWEWRSVMGNLNRLRVSLRRVGLGDGDGDDTGDEGDGDGGVQNGGGNGTVVVATS